jgi:quinolinate synthase
MILESVIADIKKTMGGRLAILAHHYESDAIVRHADILGDSLELARKIDGLDAEHIVFCGVHFMAETAAILARPEQKVHIPDESAGCVMANMVPATLAETVLTRLKRTGARIIPLTYVNSSAAVKAICGRHGGSVCTSANAATMLRWALDEGDGVLFMPDANLGRNTAKSLGLHVTETAFLDVSKSGRLIEPADPTTRLYLWPGLCAVHAKFHIDQIEAVRAAEPLAQILVHPECDPSVVEAADGAGSTSYLIKKVAELPAGSIIYVGTEWNLVNRLTQLHPDKTIRPLRNAVCSNMAKITEENLARALRGLDTAQPVRVSEDIAAPARLALERMLNACRQ